MEKMTYNNIFQRANLLGMLPLENFPPTVATHIILMQVEYGKKIKDLEDSMQEVVAKLKKDGFDARAQAISKMEQIDKNPDATESEKAEADEIRKTEADFRKEFETLTQQYQIARMAKLQEEVQVSAKPLTEELYGEIVAAIGTVGDIELPQLKEPIPRVVLLRTIAETLL